MNTSSCIFCGKKAEDNSFFCGNCNKESIESDFLDNPIKVSGKETVNSDDRIRELKKEIYALAAEKSKIELHDLNPLVKNPEYDIYQIGCRKRVRIMSVISGLCISSFLIIPLICNMFNIDPYLIWNGYPYLIFEGFIVLFMFFVMAMTAYKNENCAPPSSICDEQKRNTVLAGLDDIDVQIYKKREEIEELKNMK